MDKFLVSSPTQLSQGFDIGNDTGLLDLDHGELFNDDQNNTTSRESNTDHDDITLQADNVEFYGLDYPSQESLHDIVPISNNLGSNISNGYYNNNHRFQHSKNISLDGGNMYSKISHQSNLSTSSMVSLSQDAPSQYDADHINQSGSNNTLYSGDSIPQLSSSLSYQSFLDSPSSIKHNTHQKQQLLHVPPQNTPRRIGRNKSMSVSSCNNYNAFATPSRGPNNLSLSPVNLLSTASSKVGKTPHSLKTKGHSRSRSRLSIDATNNSLLVNNPSTGQKITTPAQNSSNYPGLNPFYTPSYVSPHLDKLGDFDDFGTPLLTPSSSNQTNPQWYNQGNSSYQQFNYLSPVANNLNYHSSSGTSSHKTNTSFTTPMVLKRNDTLDSIKIEDQDDDAFKQLGKAKSYTNFVSSKFMSNETKKPGFMEDDSGNNYRMLEKSLMDKPEIGDIKKDDDMFLNAADLSLKLASQLVSNPNGEVPDTIVSSNSTPGAMTSHNSPSRSYSVLSNNVPPATSFSVPSTAGASTSDFELKYSNHQYKAPSIDLLLPQFNSNHLTDEKLIKNNPRANHSQNTSFTKSYPASIDLASIATSPMNSNSVQNISTISSASPNNTTNGLPAMATFSVSSGQSAHATPETFIPSPQDLKLPIKVSDKTDVIDPKKKHSCPLCQARFQRPEHVKRHLKSHSSEKPYECDEPNCGKRFNRKDNLKAHLKKIHHRKL
ncbi:uncharacterized protein AC631_05743 [Debaryomyces fabryi]|uniref:C2H2-type domain-containing protein n=1 Tax=Debaryomyces fabryi TaxID=58627 RepID=A0A0V1PQQ9_9ASCO|nr:uncharacterized protein AC631_05743 [Debaryomyces fabryi]KRZ98497.1 hypothetical protein AC631_05743 [Debaryomyces fabryi]CUM49241.1 unnamed protein product [Debaryomyces fabryi]